jgi:hypothetical protein
MKCKYWEMKIRYTTGTVCEALLLSRGKDTLRAAVAGSNDALIFTHTHGTWLSEEWEPVQIEFAWGRGNGNIASEADCICSKSLAYHLIAMPLAGANDTALPGGRPS